MMAARLSEVPSLAWMHGVIARSHFALGHCLGAHSLYGRGRGSMGTVVVENQDSR